MPTHDPERVKAAWMGDTDLAAMLEGGVDALAKVFPALRPDVKTEFIAQSPEASISYDGVDGLFEGWRDWLGPWSSYVIRMTELIESGPGEVVLTGHAEARTSRDAVMMEHRPAAILTFDDAGLVSRVRFFVDSDDALRAAGVNRP